MKKILILGAGNAQIDAIQLCRKMGYEVYGCSYTDTDHGIPYLDHFVQLDIKDRDGICAYIQKNGIDAVYSVGSDLAMPTVMEVSERLGLPHFTSSATSATCQSKYKMRQALGQDFEGNIPFSVCSCLEEALQYRAFPAMMKPVDSQGQRGCYRVDSTADILAHFQQSLGFSVEGKVILEQFVDGPEISVNGYLENGELKFAIVSDRIVFDDLPGGIIKEHLIPSVVTTEETRARTISVVRGAMERLGIANGPVYVQLKLDGDRPVILEVTPRLDGCHMWNLINHYCHVNLLEAAFSHLLEGVVPPLEPRPEAGNWKLAFLCQKPGVPYCRGDYDVSKARYLFWYYQDGEVVRPLNGYMEKGGYQILCDLD